MPHSSSTIVNKEPSGHSNICLCCASFLPCYIGGECGQLPSGDCRVNVWAFKPCVLIRVQAAQLVRLVNLWHLQDNPQVADVSERVVIDDLLRALPWAHRRQVSMTNPSTLMVVVEAVKLSEAIQAREAGERASSYSWRAPGERRSTESRPTSSAEGPE